MKAVAGETVEKFEREEGIDSADFRRADHRRLQLPPSPSVATFKHFKHLPIQTSTVIIGTFLLILFPILFG